MKLFIPGPVDVRAEVLEQLSSPLISHRGDEISKLHINIISKLKQIMHTENDIVISSSSGTGSMEMALRSLTLNKALIVSNGSFGDRFYEIAKYNHIDADLHRFNDGSQLIPIY